MSFFDVSFAEMPTILPVMTFKDVFLFPESKVQLHLVEKRYVSLAVNALSHGRILALMQPMPEKKGFVPVHGREKLYTTGCAGRISAFSEDGEDALSVTLTGICRFNAVRELDDFKGYRRIEADYKPFACDFNPPETHRDLSALFKAVDMYAYSNRIDISSAAFRHLPVPALLSAIAQTLPFQAVEKQAFLESVSLQSRIETLLMLLNMEQNVDGGIKKAGFC